MDNQVVEEFEVSLRSVGASSNAGHGRKHRPPLGDQAGSTEHPPPHTGPSLSQSPTSQDRNNGSPRSAELSFVVLVTAYSASQMAVANLGFLGLIYEV